MIKLPGGLQQLRLEIRHVSIQRAHAHLLIDLNTRLDKLLFHRAAVALCVHQLHNGGGDVALDCVENGGLEVAQAGVLQARQLVVLDVVAVLF